MISSINLSVPICNRFHTIRANNGKIMSFWRGHPFLVPSFEGNLAPSSTKFCRDKLETLRQPAVKNFVILACTVLTQYSSVTDGRTDG